MAEKTIMMNKEDFESFFRCISILKDISTDIDLKDGWIRQRTDNNSSVFEIDLTTLLQDISLPITGLKQKIDLLKCFLDKEEIEISVTDESYSFSDENMTLKFENPDKVYINNPFISEEELSNIFVIDDSDLILKTTLDEKTSNRIRIVSNAFNVNNVIVKFRKNSANITTKTQAKDQQATFFKDGLLSEVELDADSYLLVTPFTIDHDNDMEFEMYLISEDVIINKFSAEIGYIPVFVYSRSTLRDIEDD